MRYVAILLMGISSVCFAEQKEESCLMLCPETKEVREIDFQEVDAKVDQLFAGEELAVTDYLPINEKILLTKQDAERLVALHLSASVNPQAAEQLPPADDEDDDLEDPFLAPVDLPTASSDEITDFSQLPLHEWEKQTIAHILTSMSEKNVFQLLLDKKDMERKGQKINHVHPLRFIGYACSDMRLKRSLRLIKKNGFKWDNLIDGFSRRLREEATRNNVNRFIPGFAELLNVEPSDVTPFIQKFDCDGLVRFLIGI